MQQIPFTREGYQRLQTEVKQLRSVERPKVIEDIATARAHGDLKENAEYHAAREKQGFVEARIATLEDQLARANIIDLSGQKIKFARFAAYITVLDEKTEIEKTFRIVSHLEADITQNMISQDSPLAKALIGREVDDVIEVSAPKGVVEYVITNISY